MNKYYQLCRVWHGYLSLIAFAWLLFFAITGILLNHPTWLAGQTSVMQDTPVQLQPAQLAAVRANSDPARAAVELLRGSLKLQGLVSSADVVGDDVFVRMKGARGSSDLRLNLKSGAGSASVETFPLPAALNQLHRGESAGAVWRGFIDVAGALLAISSILGLLLYLTLKMRVRLALVLVGGGLAVMVAGIVIFVR
jgi:hypothetical protein